MTTPKTAHTPQQVLDLPLGDNDADAGTVREYLLTLLDMLWMEGSNFSSKRPFGSSNWQFDVYVALIKAGWVSGALDEDGCVDELNIDAADQLISAAIRSLGQMENGK